MKRWIGLLAVLCIGAWKAEAFAESTRVEARGVPAQALSQLNATAYTIAGSGKIDSLNLASAVNICAYELTR